MLGSVNEHSLFLIRESFVELHSSADFLGTVFFERLFQTNPELRPMFNADIESHIKKVMVMLTTIVNGLHEPESFIPAVAALGQRHRSYHVINADFEPFGHALIWTLRQALAEKFTGEVERAWREAFDLLATIMKTAMRKPHALSTHGAMRQTAKWS